MCSTDFNLSSGSADAITDELYELEHLFGVRLCGLGIAEVPPRVCEELTSLRVLSLRSNELTALPDALGNLVYLEELSVMHNRLTSLPDTVSRQRVRATHL